MMNQMASQRVFDRFAVPIVLLILTTPVWATEVTLQNDSLAETQPGNIQAGFVASESAAAWIADTQRGARSRRTLLCRQDRSAT